MTAQNQKHLEAILKAAGNRPASTWIGSLTLLWSYTAAGKSKSKAAFLFDGRWTCAVSTRPTSPPFAGKSSKTPMLLSNTLRFAALWRSQRMGRTIRQQRLDFSGPFQRSPASARQSVLRPPAAGRRENPRGKRARRKIASAHLNGRLSRESRPRGRASGAGSPASSLRACGSEKRLTSFAISNALFNAFLAASFHEDREDIFSLNFMSKDLAKTFRERILQKRSGETNASFLLFLKRSKLFLRPELLDAVVSRVRHIHASLSIHRHAIRAVKFTCSVSKASKPS